MRFEAPGRFYTSTVWYNTLLSSAVTLRVSTSGPDPTGDGMITRMALRGYSCACAPVATMPARARATGPARRARSVIVFSLSLLASEIQSLALRERFLVDPRPLSRRQHRVAQGNGGRNDAGL